MTKEEKEWDSDKVFEMIRIVERLKKESKNNFWNEEVIKLLQKILGEKHD